MYEGHLGKSGPEEGLRLSLVTQAWTKEGAALPPPSRPRTLSLIQGHRVTAALQSLGQGEADRRLWTAAEVAVGCGLLGKNKHQRHLPFPYNSSLSPARPLRQTHLPFSSLLHWRDTSDSSHPRRERVFFPFPSQTRGEFPRPFHLWSTACFPGRTKICFLS